MKICNIHKIEVILILIIILFSIQFVYALDKTVKHIGADKLHNANFTGKDLTICLIDTGIDYTHPNLGDCTQAEFLAGNCNKVIGGWDYGENDNNPIMLSTYLNPVGYHGTVIGGILASNHNKYKGVAPDAKLVVIKVDKDDETISDYANRAEFFTNVVNGLKWCIDNSSKYDISAISLSFGYILNNDGYDEGDCPDDYGIQAKINEAIANDISVIIASGNAGKRDGIATPACLKNATAVGSSTVRLWFDDWISSHTNRGSALDLLAPGSFITSTDLNSKFTSYWDTVGTSFATPYVAGSILLLKQYDPALKPGTIERLLKKTGKPIEAIIGSASYPRIDLLAALNVLDWPFYHHDLRRTGFTLLKGDLEEDDLKSVSWTMDKDIDNTFRDFPGIADVTGDDKQEILVATSRYQRWTFEEYGKFYVLECSDIEDGKCTDYREKWSFSDEHAIETAPSIEQLDPNSERKYVVFASQKGTQGTIYAIKGNKRGKLDEDDARWKYEVPKDATNTFAGGLSAHTAIADIDNDNKMEIIFTDYSGSHDWQGNLYILEIPSSGKTFTLQQKIAVGPIGPYNRSGGAYGAVAIANIDSDDKYELIVPSSFGIYVYDYNAGSYTKLWNNSHAYIDTTATVADIDADNEYEIIYSTNDGDIECSYVTCHNKTYVIDAKTGNEECSIAMSQRPASSTSIAIANLDSDKELEIALVTREDWGSDPSYGYVKTYEHNCAAKNSFASGNMDTYNSAVDIADIDNDGKNNVILGIRNGTLYILDNDLTKLWHYNLGGQIASAPAIGDIDGDGVAEIAAKHIVSGASSMINPNFVLDRKNKDVYNVNKFSAFATADNVFSIISGNNTQPRLNKLKDVYQIETEFINLSESTSAVDDDSDALTYYYSSPLNSTTGEWNTTVNDSGTYEVFVEASDGNLTDSQFITVTVYENGTTFNNSFYDGSVEENLTYNSAGDKYTNITILQDADILRVAFEITGHSLQGESNSFQEPTPVIIEANELNLSEYTANLSVDKDWNTYYTAGSATGEIVEIQGLTIPSSPTHIIFKLKLRVFGGGYGRFGIYNYENQTYEIITSSIPALNETTNVFFDIYESGDSPLWINNETAYSMEVTDLSNYNSSNKVRWYYRYLGDWASQKIYESEVKFEEDIIYPKDVKIDIGNDGTYDYEIGELHNDIAKQDKLNNTKKNETISITTASSVMRYIDIPKDAKITDAVIKVGNKKVETLSEQQIILQQETSLVERGEKYNIYSNGDGTYTATISPRPINYFEDVEYKPIDTTLVTSEDGFEVIKGVYQAYFKENNGEVRLEKGEDYISFKPLNLNFENQEPIDVQLVNGVTDKNIINYESIFGDNFDLKYEYQNTGLKEKLIINKKPQLRDSNEDSYSEIEYLLDSNLDLYVNGEKWNGNVIETSDEIVFKDNEIIFTLPKPYAYDSDRKKEFLKYQIKEENNNTYLSIKTPYSFLQNANYPIIIDPSIKVIPSDYATVEYDDDEAPRVRPTSSINDAWRARSLIKFALTGLPDLQSAEITAATLNMKTEWGIEGESCVTYRLRAFYKEDDGWSGGGLDWGADAQPADFSQFLDNTCPENDEVWYSWDVVDDSYYDIRDDYEANSDYFSMILAFKTENADPAVSSHFYETGASGLYLNITYTIGATPVLVGCPNDETLKNSDGSDISVDLWQCYYDTDTDPDDATFVIVDETNTGLIDCTIQNNRNVTCGAPAANQIGYSDINVSADDGASNNTDMIRIFVKEPGDIKLYINNTEVWYNLHSDYDEIDIDLEIENFLEQCTEDTQGNCQVPLKIEALSYNSNFTINSLDINYEVPEVKFTDLLENYLTTCGDDPCNVPLKFTTSSEGRLNVSNLDIFYGPIRDDPPSISLVTPADDYSTYVNTITFNCSATDDIQLSNITIYTNISGTWEKNQTKDLTGLSNSTNFTITNIPYNTKFVWNCLGYDNNTQSAFATVNYSINVSYPADINKYIIQNSSSDNVTWFGDLGNIMLKGSCTQTATCTTSADSFIIKDSANNVVAYVNSTGDLCIETGDCTDQSATCNPTNNAFIIQNSTGYNVSYIDITGDLCLTGVLIENGNP